MCVLLMFSWKPDIQGGSDGHFTYGTVSGQLERKNIVVGGSQRSFLRLGRGMEVFDLAYG